MSGENAAERLARGRRLVNRWLRAALRFGKDVPPRLAQAMRYAVLGPGKRLRPVLALEAFRAEGGTRLAQVRPFCCGIEMIHAFSLVHDDLPSMDDDDFRRGRPSLHRRFDEGTAILAADALLVYAYEQFCSSSVPAERRLAAIGAISRAVGPAGMAGGQLLDLRAGARSGRKRLELVLARKTADFIAGALVSGAALAGAGKRRQERLWQAGWSLGLLFQLTDDLLDFQARSEAARPNLARRFGLEHARQRAVETSRLARRRFKSLGTGYRILAGFPALILERTS